MPCSRTGYLVCAALALVLAGCGGGGDDGSQVTNTPSPGSAPSGDGADSGAGGGGSGSGGTPPGAPPAVAVADCGLADFQTELLRLVNQARAAGATCGSSGYFAAAPALSWNERLASAAEAHSQDMVANNFFSHTGWSGSTLSQRVERAGYDWRSVGENIAAGQGTVSAVMSGWMSSPGHCANIMGEAYRQIGVACVRGGAANSYRTYWTMNLAAPR